MSLTHEFFEKRQAKQTQCENSGEYELESFLIEHSIQAQKLIDANLLEYKTIQSTADIYNYYVTDFGKPYLHELKHVQLVFVKKGKTQALLVALGL